MSISRNNVELTIDKLDEFVKSNNLDAIKIIVSQAKATRVRGWDFSHDDDVKCAVRDAILLGQTETVRFFLDEGMSPNARSYYKDNFRYSSPLISFAAESGNLAIVKLLVERGASVQSSLNLANEKFQRYYRQSVSAIEREYNEDSRITKINRIFGYYSQFEYNYPIKPEVKEFLNQLNIALHDLDKINEFEKQEIIKQLIPFFKKYSINLTEKQISEKLDNLIKDLREFDQKKRKLEIERDKIKNSYDCTVKTLLEYVSGTDFPTERKDSGLFFDEENDGLSFLKEIDISGLNLVGCSIEGKPITREMLVERKLKGADKALVSLSDLENLKDGLRKTELTERLKMHIHKQGFLITTAGIVNLVPLWRAAEIGDVAAVTARLKAGINPNDKDHISIIQCPTPIILAAEKGHIEIVKMLADHPFINKKTIVKAIEAARSNNHDEIVAYLFDLQDINAIDEAGDTLLHKAVSKIDIEQVKTLISKGADVNLKNNQEVTPLFIAASLHGEKGATMVDLLLKNGANANQYNWHSSLDLAVNTDNIESVALLLSHIEKKGLIRTNEFDEKEISDPWYVDLIFSASNKKNNIEILSLLNASGADFNAKSEYGDTLLNKAIRGLPSFSHLPKEMSGLARPDYVSLPYAVRMTRTDDFIMRSKGYLEKRFQLINFLLDNGADISFSDKKGQTPLHILIKALSLYHIEEEYKKILEFFVQKGANVNAKTQEGITPLHEAASNADLIAIEFLIKQGADINATTSIDNRTPLHQAAARGFAKTAEFLIKLGADVNAIDQDGLTPFKLCKAAQIKDKQSYRFFTVQAEHEFDEGYLKTQKILSDNASLDKKTMTELIRQRQSLLGTNSTARDDLTTGNKDQYRITKN